MHDHLTLAAPLPVPPAPTATADHLYVLTIYMLVGYEWTIGCSDSVAESSSTTFPIKGKWNQNPFSCDFRVVCAVKTAV